MWLLIAFLLVPVEGKPSSIVLVAKPTEALCEEFKVAALAKAIEMYTLTYPLTFRLECRLEKP